MLDLYFIRHAQSERNLESHLIGGRSENSPLSLRGIEQAKLLAERLSTEGIYFDRVYTSPAKRAYDTARIVCIKLNFPLGELKQDERLHELSQGDWEGQPRKEYHSPETIELMSEDPLNFTPPNGESQKMVEERMYSIIEQLQGKDERIALFGHGLAIRCLVRRILESNPAHTYKMVTDNTSITRIGYTKRGWHLLCTNDSAHLPVAERTQSSYLV